jgi:hypothetical protein
MIMTVSVNITLGAQPVIVGDVVDTESEQVLSNKELDDVTIVNSNIDLGSLED